jgi:hypothetical protein
MKTEGHSSGQAEQSAFITEALQLNAGERKKLKSKLSELVKVVGKEYVGQIQKELGIV